MGWQLGSYRLISRASMRVRQGNLPPRALRHFLPFDMPRHGEKFPHYWQPNLMIRVKHELWPNAALRGDHSGMAARAHGLLAAAKDNLAPLAAQLLALMR